LEPVHGRGAISVCSSDDIKFDDRDDTIFEENMVGALPFIIGGKIKKFVQARKDQAKKD
jgi:hypothetical protein